MQHGDRVAGLMDHLAALDPHGPDSAEADQGRHREGAPARPQFFTLPVALRSATIRVRPSAVWGAAVLLVVVLAVVGVRSAWAQRAAEPIPVSTSSVSDQDPAALTHPEPVRQGGVAESAAPSVSPDEPQVTVLMYVHVIGAVSEPGVVEVPSGARVSDVVQSAGGATRSADLSRINLARLVLDGERIWVPVRGEEPPDEAAEPIAPGVAATPDGSAAGSAGAGEGGAAAGAPVAVDINTADSGVLQTLPGVGPVTAESILAWRTEHGGFSSVEELMEVSGIGPRTLEKLEPLVTVGP
ncbi:MAG: helix-hairpin-helix domain-containing protein [Ornithinimicrobium sp.]